MRILLVDPSRAVQRIITGHMAQDAHEVIAFTEGRQALERLGADDGIRTLLTSVQLADISGLELCSMARKLAGTNRALFIIVMSSTEDYGIAVKALDHGADDFIRKPPFPEELRARLRAADRLTQMQRELIKYATMDSLTGLLNRRAFFERAAAACDGAAEGKPLAAIVFDIDHFKTINDQYGHQVGDAVLAAVGGVAAKTTEIIGRLGGEEFGLLEQCDQADAMEIAENLRRLLGNLRFPHGEGFGISCSFGVAEWEKGDTIDRLIRRADMAMYEAKNTGRNRVTAADTFALTHQHEEWRGVARVSKRKMPGNGVPTRKT